MKKTLFIVPLAVCAMAITSCGAPSISREQALSEYAAIQQATEQNGVYSAGPKFTMNATIFQKETLGGAYATSNTTTTFSADLNNSYLRMTTNSTVTQNGVSQTNSLVAYVYAKGETMYSHYEEIQAGQTVELIHDEVPFDGVTFDNIAYDLYYTVTSVFDSACHAIMAYLNKLDTAEKLKAAGVSLGSYGPGSLVIEEHVGASYGGVSQKSDTVIEFKDYKLALMQSEYSTTAAGATKEGKLKYAFDYTKVDLVY